MQKRSFIHRLPLVLTATLLTSPISPALADEAPPSGLYTLTGVSVNAIERTITDGKASGRQSDTLTHWIRFDLTTESSRKEGSEQKLFQVTNPIDMSKCSLTVDKPIKLGEEEIPAKTNLMKYRKFDGRTFNIRMPSLHPLVVNSIYLTDDFHFTPDTYTFTFEWHTADEKKLSDTVEVKIDLRPAEKRKAEAAKKKAQERKAKNAVPLKQDPEKIPET